MLKSCNQLQFDLLPIANITEPDKSTVFNVGRIMILVHFPKIKSKKWLVEEEDEHYNVSVTYPAKTIIDDKQIDLIKQVNTLLVKRVWVQPEEDCVLLCASVWKSNVTITLNVQELYIIERTLKKNTTKNIAKRIKLESQYESDD